MCCLCGVLFVWGAVCVGCCLCGVLFVWGAVCVGCGVVVVRTAALNQEIPGSNPLPF